MSNATGESAKPSRALLIAITIILLTMLTLLVVGTLRWTQQGQWVFGPTPTPTPTQRPPRTPTPDIGSTRLAQNVAAQATYEAQIGFVTPAVELTLTAQTIMLPIAAVGAEATPTSPAATPTPTATPGEIMLPVVIVGDGTPTVNPGDAPTAPESGLPSDQPSTTATPLAPSVLESPTPTPSLTPSPTFSPTPFTVGEMTARIVTTPESDGGFSDVTTYSGPSVRYDQLTPIPNDSEVRLRGRTEDGEWVYACCTGDNQSFWVRQVSAPPIDNDFYDILPTETPSDDVRWLAVQPTQAAPTPIVTPTEIPANDYPLARRNPANHARVEQLPRLPSVGFWDQGVAPGALRSQPVVVDRNVFSASEDRHLYSLEREAGNQRWRTAIDAPASFAAAVADQHVFLIDDSGKVYQWRIGEEASRIESSQSAPQASLNLIDRYLIVTLRQSNDTNQIILMDRESGDLRLDDGTAGSNNIADIPGNDLQYPAVGGQLIFVGNTDAHALDAFDNLAFVWTYDAQAPISAPPVYAQPGVKALAELYIADKNGNVEALDANTGRRLWTRSNGGREVTGMALDDTRLYISGAGFAGAIQRDDPEVGWMANVSGAVLSGPIVGRDALLVMTDSGDITYLQKSDGSVITTIREASGRGGQASAPGVVAGRWIYQPVFESGNADDNKGRLYGWQGGE